MAFVKICILPLLLLSGRCLQLYQAGWRAGHRVTNMHQRWQTASKERRDREAKGSQSEWERESGRRNFCCQRSLTLTGKTWSYLERSRKKKTKTNKQTKKNFSTSAWQKFILNLTVVNKNKPTRQKMSEKQENVFQAICQRGRSKNILLYLSFGIIPGALNHVRWRPTESRVCFFITAALYCLNNSFEQGA